MTNHSQDALSPAKKTVDRRQNLAVTLTVSIACGRKHSTINSHCSELTTYLVSLLLSGFLEHIFLCKSQMLTVLFSYFDKPVKFCALKIIFSVAMSMWKLSSDSAGFDKIWYRKSTPNLSSKLYFWTCWLNNFPNRKLKCHYHPSVFLYHLFQYHEYE